MKKYLLILLMFMPLITLAQEKVAVYVTSGSNDIDEAAKQIIGTELTSAIIATKKYDAVERTSDFLKQISTEQGYQRSGNVDDNQISAIGKQFGVDYVCVANLVVYNGTKYYIQARLIDVETATVLGVARETSSMDDIDEMILASSKVASKLFNVNMVSSESHATNNQQEQETESGMDKFVNFFKGNKGNKSNDTQPQQSVPQQPAPQPVYPSANVSSAPYSSIAPTTNIKGVKVKNGSLKKVPDDFVGQFVIGNDIYRIEKCAFEGCTALSSIIIGNSVSFIGEDAFHGCISLTDVVLPGNVLIVSNDVFIDCTNLTTVTILNGNLQLDSDNFKNCPKLSAIFVPMGTKARFQNMVSKKLRNLITER